MNAFELNEASGQMRRHMDSVRDSLGLAGEDEEIYRQCHGPWLPFQLQPVRGLRFSFIGSPLAKVFLNTKTITNY